MSTTLTRVSDLVGRGLIAPAAAPALEAVAARYALAVTPAMAELIDPTDAADPIARQFVPDPRELDVRPHELADPIGDGRFSPVPGVVHRYADRVLLKVVSACPVYCRFCFRREMVGPGGEALSGAALDAALAYVAADPGIFEVILTGGDPFMLSPRRIGDLVGRLAAIGHVAIVRWHTRVPMVDPARVTPALVAALKAPGIAPWVAVHANHPREFTPTSSAAIARLADAGVPLVSQSVLLRGVNDDAATLEALMRAFVRNRIKPYYLHHPDLAPGTAHFRPTIAEGQALTADLRRRATGLAQPTYVLDVPHGASKAPLAEARVRTRPGGASEAPIVEVLDDDGVWRLAAAD
jgi:lysine 2,3-aminomutase